MGLSFANLLGLWALLGIPIVLLIHFLQQKTKTLPISTLFLLELIEPESSKGRIVDRLRNSLLLWLQLLAVILITWLLIQPQWLRSESVQRVVLILDSSYSMLAFRDRLDVELDKAMRELESSAAKTEWIVLDSDSRHGTIYNGFDRQALRVAVGDWSPHRATHDPSTVFRVARSLVGKVGCIVWVSDHQRPLPEGIESLAIGEPINNCGLTGLHIKQSSATAFEWEVLAYNFSATAQKREWWITIDDRQTPAQIVELNPGQVRAIKGTLPSEFQQASLSLSEDAFSIDDRLPILRPVPKTLWVHYTVNNELMKKLGGSLSSSEIAPDASSADLTFSATSAFTEMLIKNQILFFTADTPAERYAEGSIVVEKHPLMLGLNWQGLLVGEGEGMVPDQSDDILLWQGTRPLIWTTERTNKRSLMINFDIEHSNAVRLPAFVLLIHRFAEQVRINKIVGERVNVELNQALLIKTDRPYEPFKLTRSGMNKQPSETSSVQAGGLSAPSEPGFFSISQGDRPYVEGAAHFADIREADFREASSFSQLKFVVNDLSSVNSERDFLIPLWVILLSVVLLFSWLYPLKKRAL